MSSSLLLKPCPVCCVRLIWMVFEIGIKWQYSCCFAGCYFQDLFKITEHSCVVSIKLFFSIRLVSIDVVHPYSSMDTATAWKKSRFILLDRSEFHIIDNISIADHAFARRISIALSIDEILLPRYVNFLLLLVGM